MSENLDLNNLNKDRKSKRKKPVDMSTMVYGKIPPHVSNLEKDVLGIILFRPASYDRIAPLLRPEFFYTTAHQLIFSAIVSLNNRNILADLALVCEEIKRQGKLDDVGGLQALYQLTNGVTSDANIENYAFKIVEKYMARELINFAGGIIQEAYEDSTDIFDLLDNAESQVMAITEKNIERSAIGMDKAIMNTLAKIAEWGKQGTGITGIPTPFRELSKVTRGFQKEDLIVIGARPSVGKTALAIKIARSSGCPGAFFSLEMPSIQIILRILSAEGRISMNRLQTGLLEEEHTQRLHATAAAVLANLKLFIDDTPSLTLMQLRAKVRKLKKEKRIEYIIIDYLQLMEGDPNVRPREQQVAQISRGLKKLAKEEDIAVIALSQLGREMEKRASKEPDMSDLRESGAVEQDADLIILLWRLAEDELKKDAGRSGEVFAKIAKQRSGGLFRMTMEFQGEYQDFEHKQGYQPVLVPDNVTLPYADDERPF